MRQLLAILAFATTVSFSTTFTFHATVIDCPEPNDVVRSVVSYPFAWVGRESGAGLVVVLLF